MRRIISPLLVILLAAGLTAAETSSRSTQQLTRELDRVAERVLREFRVPGMAVTVVKDGQVIHAKGYGVRRLGETAAVDHDTVFQIASNTKAFTSAALAILVDEKKLQWDDPVRKHLPDFDMHDPFVARELTVRDLLIHNSGLGLGAGDLLWWPTTNLTASEIVSRLRFIKPATSFRSRYAYDNLLYLVAGRVIERVSGKSWADFIRERLLIPLSMTSTTTDLRGFRPESNIATPHAPSGDQIEPQPYDNAENVAAAAAINSTAADLAKWMIAQLNEGELPGKTRLWSEEQSREMWMPQTIIRVGKPTGALAFMAPRFAAYGLGWSLRDYRGLKIVAHSGALTGMYSRVMLVPELKLGIALLTNQQAMNSQNVAAWHVVNHFAGGPPIDWVTAFAKANAESSEKFADEEKKLVEGRARDTKPSLPLAEYAGTYTDPWYGDATLTLENGRLVMRFSRTPDLIGDLEHYHYDTFIVRWRRRALDADAFVTFSLNTEGKVERIRMKAISSRTDFSFDFHDLDLVKAP